jgi:Txe/YoeB family toxin of toxin-antitoxin system
VLELIQDFKRNPWTGLGKPEPLKYLKGQWSRKIDPANRLVYQMSGKGDSYQLMSLAVAGTTNSSSHRVTVYPKSLCSQTTRSLSTGGISGAESMLALGGAGRYDMFICQTASPLPRLPIATPFSMTFDTT